MFGRPARLKPDLNIPIQRVLDEMEVYGPDTPEFPKLVTELERLQRIKGEKKPKIRVSPDTMAIVVGNLLGILIIVSYERSNAMVSKAKDFILKPK